jgi:hypothetical protein
MTNEMKPPITSERDRSADRSIPARDSAATTGTKLNIATWLGILGITMLIIGGISTIFWPEQKSASDSQSTSSTIAGPGTSKPAGAFDNNPQRGQPMPTVPTDRSENAHPSDRSKTQN